MAKQRTKVVKATDIADRRAKVAVMYLRGETQTAIAGAVKVDQATVSRDLAALREEWRADAVRNFGERQAEELARLDQLEREAWAAWERSQQPAQVDTAEMTADDKGKKSGTKTARRTEGRDGEPRFLQIVRECIAARRELFGLDAPKRTDTRVEFPGLPDLKGVPDEKLRALDRLLADCLIGGTAALPTGGSG